MDTLKIFNHSVTIFILPQFIGRHCDKLAIVIFNGTQDCICFIVDYKD